MRETTIEFTGVSNFKRGERIIFCDDISFPNDEVLVIKDITKTTMTIRYLYWYEKVWDEIKDAYPFLFIKRHEGIIW